MSQSWVLCSDCHRVLWTADGPTCPECLAKRPKQKPEDLVESPESQQPMPPVRPKRKAENKVT